MSDSEPNPKDPNLVNLKETTELDGLSAVADQILTDDVGKPDITQRKYNVTRCN